METTAEFTKLEPDQLRRIVKSLCAMPRETPWVEFKDSNDHPEKLGQNISAIANSAAIEGKDCGYIVWGVSDDTHEIVGTTTKVESRTIGNEEMENWLRRMLSDHADFAFRRLEIDGRDIVLLRVQPAAQTPIQFKHQRYIRVGSYTKKLDEYPGVERCLRGRLLEAGFESQLAADNPSLAEAIDLLDDAAYYKLQKLPIPDSREERARQLERNDILRRNASGLYGITNLGALLFAKELADFPGLALYEARVIRYEGNNRLIITREYTLKSGYAVGFEALMGFVVNVIPSREDTSTPVRTIVKAFPADSVREIIANALIHQDFRTRGLSMRVEIFDNRIEVTNGGEPLVDTMRIIDDSPKTRNPGIAHLMRTFGFCEELGRGWDRIAIAAEQRHLPAPQIVEGGNDSTKVIQRGQIPYADMTQEDRVWTCYLHACSKWADDSALTNASLRKRFGLPGTASSNVSRVIRRTVDEGLIIPVDPGAAPRRMSYKPYWA